MIAAELGGGGGCDPSMTDFTEAALLRCLQHLGITPGASDSKLAPSTCVKLGETLSAPTSGLLDRSFAIGDRVEAGQSAGWLHFANEPERPSMELTFARAGIILAHSNRGMVERGDMIAVLASPCELEE